MIYEVKENIFIDGKIYDGKFGGEKILNGLMKKIWRELKNTKKMEIEFVDDLMREYIRELIQRENKMVKSIFLILLENNLNNIV